MKDSSVVKFFYYFFKTLGLAPTTYNSKRSFCTSTQSLVYNVIFMSYVSAMNCYAVKLTLHDNPAVQFDRTIDSVQRTIGASTSLIVVGTFCIRRKKCVKIANKLKALYDLSTFHHEGLLTSVIKETCLIIFFTWLSLLLTIPVSSYQAILYFTAVYFCDAIVSSTMLQYSLLLVFLRRLFAIVNDNFSKFTCTTRIQFVGSKDQLATTRFAHLRDLHVRLSEVCEELARFYSLPALLCIFYIFSTLILAAYYVVKSFFFNQIGISTTFLFNCFAQMIHWLTVLLILTRSASTVIEESKRTGSIVNKMESDDRFDRVMAKVNQFSSYLLHQNTRFSAAGLFSIDGTLLMSVVGSITTYIVILLQFQDRNCTQRQTDHE